MSYIHIKKQFPQLLIFVILAFILLITSSLFSSGLLFPIINAASARSATTTTVQPYEITTRGNLPYPTGVQGNGYNNKYPLLNIKQLFNNCPNEIAIIVHGWPLNETQAKERFDRAKMSLEHDQYPVPIVGFSWESNTTWANAKQIANENGPELAHFIFDYKNTCKHQHNKDVNVRLVAHSLGARVVLSTLEGLNNIAAWNTNHFNITSVHLMGPAVDDEEVSRNASDTGDSFLDDDIVYGKFIQKEVVHFFNLYDREDNMLKPALFPPVYYPAFEGDLPLGYHGKQAVIDSPTSSIYRDINVENEIRNIDDSDGDHKCDLPNPFIPGSCTINAVGENHLGYFGFRSAVNGTLIDDGAMNVVVSNWRNP
jgi:Alpha/beta hydrolase of unknown function (DUF900)